MKEQILKAVNEVHNEQFKTFEDIFDLYSDDECIDAWLEYEGICGYSYRLKKLFSTFYNMHVKTDKELFGSK